MDRSRLFLLSCFLWILGILLIDVVRILPSMSMILLVLVGISYWINPVTVAHQGEPKVFYILSLTFWVLLPSVFYSDNTQFLFQKWQIAVPYLLLPLALVKIPIFSKTHFYRLYLLYFSSVFLICVFAFVNYLLNQAVINQMYLESKVMPTLVSHHPTFSLMIVFACYVGYYLFQQDGILLFKNEKKLLLVGGIFLFIFLHIFSVRSGLLALYALLFMELLRIAVQTKQVKKVLIAGLLFIVIGGATMFLSPTVSNKITNTTQDLSNYKNNGSANNQSLSSRIISYKNAFRIAQESSIWFGCGLGDIDDLNQAIFAKEYPDVSKPIDPHNQFLYYYAALGIVGLLIFTLSFYFPLVYKKAYQNRLLFAHYFILTIGFMFEAPFANQLGVAYSAIFIMLPLHQLFGRN
jgi:O-antigen ligase